MSERETRARELFKEGYSCSQSVLGAYAECLDMEFETLMKIASSFGGGMGRLREVCGAVSGMFMVAGYLYGYDSPKDYDGKKQHYARIQELAGRFREENGSIICRELLGIEGKDNSPVPSRRTAGYYRKRPCEEMVACAVRILEAYEATEEQ